MKEITLTRGLVTKVSDEDFPFLSQFKWQAVQASNTTFYARRSVRQGKKMTYILMHRIVAQTPSGLVTDHINHDTLDNTRGNLRNVSQQVNLLNRSNRKRNSEQFSALNNSTTVIPFRHTIVVKNKLDEIALSLGISTSKLIKQFVDKELERYIK